LAGFALLLIVGFVHGYLARWKKIFPDAYIRKWIAAEPGARSPSPAASAPAAASEGAEDSAKLDALLSLGYAAGYVAAREAKGVVQHDRRSVAAGYNLLLSGHAPAAYLLDMDGEVIHSWAATFEDFWPGRKETAADIRRASRWKRAHLFPNGDLIAMFESYGLVKLDRRSRILWRFTGPVHHDLDVDEHGRIFTLLRRAHRIERIDKDALTIEDFLVILDSDGRQLEEISILEALERSSYASLLKVRAAAGGILYTRGDVLHTNTVTLLNGRLASRHPSFKKGNVLLALRSLDLVAVLDPKKREVVWGLTGMWIRPHEPVLLENGRLLLFDNAGWTRGSGELSRALELDPVTQELKWSYTGPPDFHSTICGLVQRLPNGNTLITVSTEGRVVEVTPAGRVVWEFLNPYSTVVQGQERVATIFEMVRLPKSSVAALVSERD
jgi:hypothetical protein